MEQTADDSEWNVLNLDNDETEHLKDVSDEISHNLLLAEKASIIAVNGIMSQKEYPHIHEPEGLASLLLVKSAKNVRFAVKGLKLGYYSGASAVLRSAFEDLAYATLFQSEPSQIAKWFRNEFSNAEYKLLISFREQQKKDAKRALFSRESHPNAIKDGLSEFISRANIRIHPSIGGLSEEFGIDLGYFVDRELAESLSAVDGDLTQALDRYVLKASFDDFLPREKTAGEERETVYIELPGRYDEATLSDLALFAFYVAHRLLDSTKEYFDIGDKDFFEQYKYWHKAMNDQGEYYTDH